MNRRFVLTASIAAIICMSSFGANAKDSFVIGLSNGWVGSEWRTQMID
jgi:ribose transport system substrate-binding protein